MEPSSSLFVFLTDSESVFDQEPLSGLITRPVDVNDIIQTVTVNVNKGWVGAAFR